jgi:uncharacterized protein DUF6200
VKQTTINEAAPDDLASSTNGKAAPTILLDLGTKRRKNIKRLRKGRGNLMARLNETIEDFKRDETISASSQIVIVVVKQRRKSRGLFG